MRSARGTSPLARYNCAMTRREERQRGTASVVAIAQDDGSFDREFWRQVPPAQRLEMVWDMVVEYLAWKDPDGGQPRLQRSVCSVERRER